MSSNFGKPCRDGIFGNLQIKSRTVLDKDGNLCVTSIKNKGPLKTDYLIEKTTGHGVVVQSDLCVDSGYVVQTDCLDDKTDNGILVKADLCVENTHLVQTDCIDDKTGNGIRLKADACLDSGHVVKVNGTQVVTAQQPPVGNANGGSGIFQVAAVVNDILNRLRAHGLIADVI